MPGVPGSGNHSFFLLFLPGICGGITVKKTSAGAFWEKPRRLSFGFGDVKGLEVFLFEPLEQPLGFLISFLGGAAQPD